jgi:hypothetical protein
MCLSRITPDDKIFADLLLVSCAVAIIDLWNSDANSNLLRSIQYAVGPRVLQKVPEGIPIYDFGFAPERLRRWINVAREIE